MTTFHQFLELAFLFFLLMLASLGEQWKSAIAQLEKSIFLDNTLASAEVHCIIGANWVSPGCIFLPWVVFICQGNIPFESIKNLHDNHHGGGT